MFPANSVLRSYEVFFDVYPVGLVYATAKHLGGHLHPRINVGLSRSRGESPAGSRADDGAGDHVRLAVGWRFLDERSGLESESAIHAHHAGGLLSHGLHGRVSVLVRAGEVL